MLGTLRAFVWRTHIIVHQIDVLALEALLHHACKEPQAALTALEQALALAAPAEIVRPFVDLGQAMATLLREAAQGGAQADYATTVLAAFPEAMDRGVVRGASVQTVQQTPLDRLTNRELDVLALLSQRLSNKEIASILVLTPGTVKKHISHLCAKLDVSGRREAVARARALGLIDSHIS
jgi:LuxR family maltose regulon positive regulatory protein